MRYAVFGDIHSNLEAFRAVADAFKKENIDKYICVGDIVGYGADPHQCIEDLKNLNAKTVCGNHDWASVGLINADYFNYAARAAVEWTQEALTPEEETFLKSLPLVINEDNFSIVHGSLDKPDSFYYVMDTESAYRCFLNMEQPLCFVGHSHVPVVFFMEKDRIGHSFDSAVAIKPETKYIVNVGSIGQPRDSNPLAAYCVFDTDKKTIEIKRVEYDIAAAKDKILKAGLPEFLGHRLLEGR